MYGMRHIMVKKFPVKALTFLLVIYNAIFSNIVELPIVWKYFKVITLLTQKSKMKHLIVLYRLFLALSNYSIV